MTSSLASTTTIPIEDLKEWAGQDVVDPVGEKLGRLEEVLYDTETDIPAFAAIKSGTFGKHLTLVALAGATAGQTYIRVPVDKKQFKKAPSFDPETELSTDDEAEAYGYYGLEYKTAGMGARRLAKH
ncbi:MAG: hypothetical protein QOE11_3361 [Solirubrobacteraceae bacterium]|jgi:hypothetical protein|nr:hypothetical protein [Solirubrobacteraceae bacterium]